MVLKSPRIPVHRVEPDHPAGGKAEGLLHLLRIQREREGDAPVHLDAAGQDTGLHQVVDVALDRVRLPHGGVVVILPDHRPHPRPGRIDRHLGEVLVARQEAARVGVDVDVDRAREAGVLSPGPELLRARVLLEEAEQPAAARQLAESLVGDQAHLARW